LLLANIKILILRVLENGRKAPTLNKKTLLTKVQHSARDKFCTNDNLKIACWGRCLIGFICKRKSHQKLETRLARSEDTIKFNAFRLLLMKH